MRWQWSFFEAMRSRCVLDKRYYRFWCDYLVLTIVDDVFRCYGLSRSLVGSQDICRFFIVSRWFWRFLRYFHICWFFKFTIIIIYKFFLLNHLGPMFFQVYWPFYAIFSGGCQPSVQRCNVWNVSFKSSSKLECFREFWRILWHIVTPLGQCN